MSRLTVVARDYASAQESEPRESGCRVAPESTDAVVLAFPRLLASQADLIDSIRDHLETAYEVCRSPRVAAALVEAHALLDALEVD